MDKDQTISLVVQAQNGDKAAFDRLYREFGKAVYFNCLKLTGNEQSAQDILQDTFFTAFQKISDLKFPENFSAWIIRIAVNKCKMSFRSAVPQTDDEEVLEEFKDDGMIPDDYVDSEEKRKIIMDIIDTVLTPEQRQTIILYYYDSMSVAEISKIMECPVGSVTSRLSAARQKIREAVLIYEKENNDRLHVIVPVPILTQILNKEAEKLTLPPFNISACEKAESNTENSQTNSDSRFDNSVQKTNIKPGGKSMLNSIKAKIIAVVAAVAVVGGGITAAVVLNSDNEVKTDTSSSVSKTQKNDETSAVTAGEDSSSEISEEEGVKFWITQQKFTSAPLSKLPEDFTILDTKLSMPITYEKLDEYYQSADRTTNEMYGLSYKEVFEKKIIKGHQKGSYRDEYKNYLYAKGMTNGYDDTYSLTYGDLYTYNYSNEDKTADECFKNNWWEIEYTDSNGNGNAYRFMGIAKDELGENTGEKALDQLVQKLGTPTYFSPLLTDKTPQEIEQNQFTEDLVMLTYVLAWEYDDYVVSVNLSEMITNQKNKILFTGMSVMPKEAWNKKYENNKEVNDDDGRKVYFEYDNKIDLIADSSLFGQSTQPAATESANDDSSSSSSSDNDSETNVYKDLRDLDLHSDAVPPEEITVTYKDKKLNLTQDITQEDIINALGEEPYMKSDKLLLFGHDKKKSKDVLSFSFTGNVTFNKLTLLLDSDTDCSLYGINKNTTPQEMTDIMGTPTVGEILRDRQKSEQALSWADIPFGDAQVFVLAHFRDGVLYDICIMKQP